MNLFAIHMSRDTRFPKMWYVRPAKSQISLRIHAGNHMSGLIFLILTVTCPPLGPFKISCKCQELILAELYQHNFACIHQVQITLAKLTCTGQVCQNKPYLLCRLLLPQTKIKITLNLLLKSNKSLIPKSLNKIQ